MDSEFSRITVIAKDLEDEEHPMSLENPLTEKAPSSSSTESSSPSQCPPNDSANSLERFPNEILLLCLYHLSFDDLFPIRNVSKRFRSLFDFVLMAGPDDVRVNLWYRNEETDQFFDSCLDRRNKRRSAMITGKYCLGTTDCWCLNCTGYQPVPSLVHRLVDECYFPYSWMQDVQLEMDYKRFSFVRDLRTTDPKGCSMWGWSMFNPPISNDLPIRIEYKVYRPDLDETRVEDWEVGLDDGIRLWPYEHCLAGATIKLNEGDPFITVSNFLTELWHILKGPWRWMEERFVVTGISVNTKASRYYGQARACVAVTLKTKHLYEEEIFFDKAEKRYNIPVDM